MYKSTASYELCKYETMCSVGAYVGERLVAKACFQFLCYSINRVKTDLLMSRNSLVAV